MPVRASRLADLRMSSTSCGKSAVGRCPDLSLPARSAALPCGPPRRSSGRRQQVADRLPIALEALKPARQARQPGGSELVEAPGRTSARRAPGGDDEAASLHGLQAAVHPRDIGFLSLLRRQLGDLLSDSIAVKVFPSEHRENGHVEQPVQRATRAGAVAGAPTRPRFANRHSPVPRLGILLSWLPQVKPVAARRGPVLTPRARVLYSIGCRARLEVAAGGAQEAG